MRDAMGGRRIAYPYLYLAMLMIPPRGDHMRYLAMLTKSG